MYVVGLYYRVICTWKVISWLNSILDEDAEGAPRAPIDLTALDRRVSSIVPSVEIVAEETSSQLERIIDDTLRGALRLAHDLRFTKNAISIQTSPEVAMRITSAKSPGVKGAFGRSQIGGIWKNLAD